MKQEQTQKWSIIVSIREPARWAGSLISWRQQMGKKLYVGNLSYGVTDSNLEQMFAAHGTVTRHR